MLTPILASGKFVSKLIFELEQTQKIYYLCQTERIHKNLKNHKMGKKKYPSLCIVVIAKS